MTNTINNKETCSGINVLKEVALTMDDVLHMFPESSYKYGLLIPVIALLIDGKYTVGKYTYTLSPNDRVYLESFVFYRDEKGRLTQKLMYPDFENIGKSVSFGSTNPWVKTDYAETGYTTHVGYIRSKRYITVRFLQDGGKDVITVNLTLTNPTINDFINQVCNCAGIPQQDRSEFIQILSSTRMVMNAA